VTVVLTPVATFLIATCALGMTALEDSDSTPERVAPVTCAQAGPEINRLNPATPSAKTIAAALKRPATAFPRLSQENIISSPLDIPF
jgi:hypothetical protein